MTNSFPSSTQSEGSSSFSSQSHILPESLPFTKFSRSLPIKTSREEYEISKRELRYVHFYHGGMARGNNDGGDEGAGGTGPRVWGAEVKVRLLEGK